MDKSALLRKTTRILAKITVLMGPGEFKRFDSYCRRHGFKKSTLLARLVRDHMDREGFQVQPELPLDTPETWHERQESG
jgi:hypothetical protein